MTTYIPDKPSQQRVTSDGVPSTSSLGEGSRGKEIIYISFRMHSNSLFYL